MAITEEMREFQTQLRQLKDQGFECEQKLVKLQKIVCELSKKKLGLNTNAFAMEVCLVVSAVVFLGLAVMYMSGKLLSCAFGLVFMHFC